MELPLLPAHTLDLAQAKRLGMGFLQSLQSPLVAHMVCVCHNDKDTLVVPLPPPSTIVHAPAPALGPLSQWDLAIHLLKVSPSLCPS